MQVSFSILRANGEAGKVYTADGDVVVFGRSDECDVQLDDGYVSGRHAEIHFNDGRFYLQDLKSTNGTWLRGSRVESRIQIADNAIIEFGKGGPKVRIVSMLGQGAVAVPASTSGPNVVREMRTPEPAISFRADTSRPLSSNAGLQLLSFAGAGVLAIVAVIFLVRPFLQPSENKESTDSRASSEPSKPENPGDGDTGRSSPAVSPETAETPETSAVDYARIAEMVQDQSVWIGLKVESGDQVLVYPLCNGWLYSTSQVVATGSAIADLETDSESHAIVVYSHRLPDSDPFIEVKSMQIHPDFVKSKPESSASVENNLGLLELSRPLPDTQLSDPVEVDIWRKSFNGGSVAKLIQCGYSISLKPEPISALSMPRYSWSSISNGDAIPGSSVKSLPLIRVSCERAQETRSGHVVVNANGKIFGTLLHIDATNAILIPIDRVSEFAL